MKRLLFTFIAAALCAGSFAPHGLAGDATPATPVRKVMGRYDQSGVPGKEILIGTVTFLAGGTVGYHTHPGDESGYVVRGSVTLKTQGQPDRHLEAGEGFFNVRGAVHSVTAGTEGATVFSNWIVDKGLPTATPVP